jgi:hypothetical protein
MTVGEKSTEMATMLTKTQATARLSWDLPKSFMLFPINVIDERIGLTNQ